MCALGTEGSRRPPSIRCAAVVLIALLLMLLVETAHVVATKAGDTDRLLQQDDLLCNHAVTPTPIEDTSAITSTYGILFTISPPHSSQRNGGITITSLGFYVDPSKIDSVSGGVTYEAHTRRGHYADPYRTGGGEGGLPLDSTWDYRGNFTYWQKVADGGFTSEELVDWPPSGSSDQDGTSNSSSANYFLIPFEDFKPVSIEEGVQSVYITVREVSALLSAPKPSFLDLHDEQQALHCDAPTADSSLSCADGGSILERPTIHIGEGVVSYPFSSVPYFYQPRQFMGSVYYQSDCSTRPPSEGPSATLIPSSSRAPSHRPTAVGTTAPSRSSIPTASPSSSQLPTTPYWNAGQFGCHRGVSTDQQYESFKNQTSASYGLVFAIKSNDKDDDGVWITSLGFHVDLSALPPSLEGVVGSAVDYEVYALKPKGLYADLNRTSANDPVTFDYRGDFDLWKLVSTGTISEADLVDGDYFQIPWGGFEPTFLSPLGGMRSFYLTLDAGAFVFQDPDRKEGIGKVQKDDDFDENIRAESQHPPMLLCGEGVIGYPFRDTPFLYTPKRFIGRVFYEYECPSQSPSFAPSLVPSRAPSVIPSSFPSPLPSLDPSETPSLQPSVLPTTSSSPTHEFWPSASPTISRSPTPSFQPSRKPATPPKQQTSSAPDIDYLRGLVSVVVAIIVVSF